MPTRYIKESARTSKNLGAVEDFSERLFWRLITTADDFGRFLGCPVIVKSTCFPLMEALKSSRVEGALQDLASHELIHLYQVGDREYGVFLNWIRHQGEPRAKGSKYPDPPIPTSVGMCGHVPTEVPGAPNTNTNLNSSPNLHLKSNGQASPKRVLRPISEDDKPTEKHLSFGRSLNLDVGPEWGKFKNYCLAHDKRYANFEAAFRNWLANAEQMKDLKGGRV